jgi:hypothetical protein
LAAANGTVDELRHANPSKRRYNKPTGYDIIAMHLAAINCFESCCFAWASVAVAAAAETRTRRHGQIQNPIDGDR